MAAIISRKPSITALVREPIEQSSWKQIWELSWPMLINMMTIAASSLVEGWIAGRLGPAAQSGAGIGNQIWYFVMMLTLALSAGTTAVISQFWGAGNRTMVISAARQSLILSVLFGVASSAVGLLLCKGALPLFGASAAVESEAWNYLKFTLASIIPSTILWISNSIFRAKGDSLTPMKTMMLVTVLMIVLELILCLPLSLGVSGIGISWIVACSIGLVINFNALKRSDLADCLRLRDPEQPGSPQNLIWQFLSIGLPACVQDISLLLGSFGVFFILGTTTHSVTNQAAWAAGWRIEEVAIIMPMYALNMAAATLVGQSIGAGNIRRAKRIGWQITVCGVGLALIVSLALFMLAPQVAAAFSDDAATSAACLQYLKIILLTEPFFAAWLILSGAMQGAAYTKLPMVVTIFAFNIVRLSIAWVTTTANIDQAENVWTAMALSTIVAGATMLFLWWTERWAPKDRGLQSTRRLHLL